MFEYHLITITQYSTYQRGPLVLNMYTFLAIVLGIQMHMLYKHIHIVTCMYKNANYLITHFTGVAQLLIFANRQCLITLLSWWKFCLLFLVTTSVPVATY